MFGSCRNVFGLGSKDISVFIYGWVNFKIKNKYDYYFVKERSILLE